MSETIKVTEIVFGPEDRWLTTSRPTGEHPSHDVLVSMKPGYGLTRRGLVEGPAYRRGGSWHHGPWTLNDAEETGLLTVSRQTNLSLGVRA